LEGAEIGVAIVEPDDEADRDLVVLEVIEKGAAIGRAVERPADRMKDEARLVARRIDLPQLLDADAVGLRVGGGTQIEALDQCLGQRAAAALSEEGLLADQLDAGLEGVGRLAVLADAHAAGSNALDAPFFVVEHLGTGEARIDLDAERLRLLRQPAAEIAKAGDVV